MDYSNSLVVALQRAKCTTAGWNKPSINYAIKAVQQLAKKGPITAKSALLVSTLFPSAFTFASTPLVEIKKADAGAGPNASDLAPKIHQGLQSWYWNLTNFVSAAGVQSGVLFVIKQTTIDAESGLSVWSVDAGAVDPATMKWVSPATVYLDSNTVSVIPNGLLIRPNSQIAGTVAVTATSFAINVSFLASGFSFSVNSSSARGPTYEQGSGNVKRIGPLQNGYWSIVDGVVTTGTLQIRAADAVHKFDAAVPQMSWLDYQQFGVSGISYMDQLLAAAIKAPAAQTRWMFLVVQTPSYQLDAYILNAGLISKLKAGKAAKSFTANVWQKGAAAVYDVACTAQIMDVYPTSAGGGVGVPSVVQLSVGAPLNLTFVLTTTCPLTQPMLKTAGGSGYDSPSVVTVNGKAVGTGVIEWVPGSMYPTQKDVLAESGVSADILKATNPNPAAQAALAFFIIFVVLFIASLVLIPLCVVKSKGK